VLILLFVGLIGGCTCGSEATEGAELTVPRLAPAAPPELAVPLQPTLEPAPMRTVWGLSLGSTDATAIGAWVEAPEASCERLSSPRRLTEQQRCTLNELPGLMADRSAGGAPTALLLARPESGPLHHVSTIRRHGRSAVALADYRAASAAITEVLGAPDPAAAADPTVEGLATKHVRFVRHWRFSDLQVELSLSKLGTSAVVVRERWDVPGVEAGVPPRPGSVGHSAGGTQGPHSPHGIVPVP
jgi:hypothetical protein